MDQVEVFGRKVGNVVFNGDARGDAALALQFAQALDVGLDSETIEKRPVGCDSGGERVVEHVAVVCGQAGAALLGFRVVQRSRIPGA